MIVPFAAMAMLAAAPPTPQCGLAHLQACPNTNVLTSDKPFVRAVRGFVGPGRARYVYRGAVADQQMEVLGGPPDGAARIGERYRFTACRQHSCDEKGAVVLEPDGRIVATAILHFPSACLGPGAPEDCTRRMVLTVFVRNPAAEQGVIDNLSDWARDEVARVSGVNQWAHPHLEAIEVYSAGTGAPKRVTVTKVTTG